MKKQKVSTKPIAVGYKVELSFMEDDYDLNEVTEILPSKIFICKNENRSLWLACAYICRQYNNIKLYPKDLNDAFKDENERNIVRGLFIDYSPVTEDEVSSTEDLSHLETDKLDFDDGYEDVWDNDHDKTKALNLLLNFLTKIYSPGEYVPWRFKIHKSNFTFDDARVYDF